MCSRSIQAFRIDRIRIGRKRTLHCRHQILLQFPVKLIDQINIIITCLLIRIIVIIGAGYNNHRLSQMILNHVINTMLDLIFVVLIPKPGSRCSGIAMHQIHNVIGLLRMIIVRQIYHGIFLHLAFILVIIACPVIKPLQSARMLRRLTILLRNSIACYDIFLHCNIRTIISVRRRCFCASGQPHKNHEHCSNRSTIFHLKLPLILKSSSPQ